MELDHFLLHLSLIDNIGPATINKIISIGQELNLLPNSILNYYNFTSKDFNNLGFSNNISNKLVAGLKDRSLLDKELSLIDKYNVKMISCYSKDYPELLKTIYLPPAILYLSNKKNINFNKCISIVGSRQASQYGDYVINNIVPVLVKYGYTIVSGGAIGIDTLSHKAAIKSDGATISVLGSGLLKPYPSTNKELFSAINKTDNSCIISPFSLNTNPHPGNFPARNRIISGLSLFTLVVQAAESSGSLITAQYALDQGRDVGAVPGNISDPLSAGCHKLISEGASLISKPEDILSLLDENILNTATKAMNQNINAVKNETNESLSTEEKILKILEIQGSAISIENISSNINMLEHELEDLLFNMQLEGLVEQDLLGYWKIKSI